MILHMGHELPVKEEKTMNCESVAFTSEEMRIVKKQIRRNRAVIDDHIRRIDLFVNHERHASRDALIEQLRERLGLLMEENDTFRTVLWQQFKQENLVPIPINSRESEIGATLVNRLKKNPRQE